MSAATDLRTSTVIDIAGAQMGGAAKFLGELTTYLAANPGRPIRLIGTDRSLDPDWLLRREVAARGARRRIALNNVGFAAGRSTITLLRNALHFASAAELDALHFRPTRTLRVQTRIVRAAAHRSDVLVVPCDAMAERVSLHAPRLAGKIVVRAHPVSSAPWAARSHADLDDPTILMPVLNAPYKRLHLHIERLIAALASSGEQATLVVTADAAEFGPLGGHPGVHFTGPLKGEDLDRHWSRATAVYFPTQLESFGYPLAEARVNGLPVIALDTAQNRQIAGAALRAFVPEDPDSLTVAVRNALTVPAQPDPGPFSPQAYFDWLLDTAC
ncbi:MAG TPA: glycosyltransferase [Nocardioidaceae bacterium]|nr:glycosyltransferase [Nocardioidaceae bacterium]